MGSTPHKRSNILLLVRVLETVSKAPAPLVCWIFRLQVCGLPPVRYNGAGIRFYAEITVDHRFFGFFEEGQFLDLQLIEVHGFFYCDAYAKKNRASVCKIEVNPVWIWRAYTFG